MEIVKENIDKSNPIYEKINDAYSFLVHAHDNLRITISRLKNNDYYNEFSIQNDLVSKLSELFDSVSPTCVKYKIFGIEGLNIGSEIEENILYICTEAITNSIKHGKATEVNINIKSTVKDLRILIVDNGLGCDNVVKLHSIESRVKGVNGILDYGSGDEGGFNISIIIPIQVNL